MRRFPLILVMSLAAAAGLTSCLDNNGDDIDKKWRDANIAYYEQQANLKDNSGHKFYTLITSPWDAHAQVLMHWYNDTTETAQNLRPFYTSTVDVKYRLQLYDGTAIDSSYTRTSPADSVLRATLNSGVIMAWPISITQMHIGDSCRIVAPYTVCYGANGYGNIKPFTTLVFDVKLVGIPYYETKQ